MKLKLTFKGPDSLHDALGRANLSEEEREEMYDAASEWLTYGEYIDVEIDTELDTCTVIKPKG
jgi:hypothetical protein